MKRESTATTTALSSRKHEMTVGRLEFRLPCHEYTRIGISLFRVPRGEWCLQGTPREFPWRDNAMVPRGGSSWSGPSSDAAIHPWGEGGVARDDFPLRMLTLVE